jgi:hypothetical protein
MVSDIKSAIVYKLKELYPTYKRYTDDVPQNFVPPGFVIFEIDQDYEKRINTKYKSRIGFDVAYFSDKPTMEIKSDCLVVQEVLHREFDLVGTFRTVNKNARITDNVLHMTFDINYSEMKTETVIPMQTQTTTINN